ncbi:PilC/PilY family type IV pilus protein [uncultured Aquabacterium sp.]|uniref:pilus assembly protein n=1 Tax=uncultured Aquabacterium sp. TaxID=158753 RepID=UPI002610721E|nr:PilC/PilY family type IV pilus protein [uncultured Aquabacterium sp.]
MSSSRQLAARAAPLLATVAIALPAPWAHGGLTDIASEPLITSQTAAKPNILFILDDSGSMGWEYMPDDMSPNDTYGYKSSQCNGVGYNPALPYDRPLTADGRLFPAMSITAAWPNGFLPTIGGSVATTSSTSLTMPAVGTHSRTGVTVAPTTARLVVASTSNITVGARIAAISTDNTAHWVTGVVTAVNSTSREVTFTLDFASATSTYSSWTVGPVTTNNRSGQTYYTYRGAQQALNWVYTSAGADSTSTFYQECRSRIGNEPGSRVFTGVTVSATSDEAGKYANWYSYYRTRMLTMKTGVSRAFADLDDKKRIGYTRISDATLGDTSFLPVADFNDTQKVRFYSQLFKAPASGTTPLRGALSKAGRYFAGKAPGQTSEQDPVQYSCQRNYALLSTDGYWNTGSESTTYGPLKLNGTDLVGQQDGLEVRPMYDGAAIVVTSTSTITRQSPQQQTASTYLTQKNQRRTVATGSKDTWYCGSRKPYKVTQWTEQQTQSIYTRTTVVADVTQSRTHTVETTNGRVTRDTYGDWTTTSSTEISRAENVPVSTSTGSWGTVSGSTNTNCVSSTPYTSTPTYGTTTLHSTVGPNLYSTAVTDLVAVTQTESEPEAVTSTAGGSSNSLADVAQYYYATDLRTEGLNNCTGSLGVNVCGNDVTASGRDAATHQHMTTFTIGLGVKGTLAYDPNYLTQATGDYVNLKNGPAVWPVPVESSTGGSANNVDDLWHAAVNGRGRYFKADDPQTLSESLNQMFKDLDEVNGAGTSAATSSLEPVQGTDQIYLASYATVAWTGDVKAYDFEVNRTTGEITKTEAWSVLTGLDSLNATTAASRSIHYMLRTTGDGAVTHSLRALTWANLTADGHGSGFSNLCSKTPTPAQCPKLATTNSGGFTQSPLDMANDGTTLLSYLRGDPTHEGSTLGDYGLFRARKHKLGDIVGGSPVYVGPPVFGYGDTGYGEFKQSKASRKPMLYVAANDGMLHAFSAARSAPGSDGGTELWAFVPSMVLPHLYRLADTEYTTRHRFYVDAPPVVADIKVGSNWKTILIGGLGAGGRGYYALDITDPASPQALWEFTHDNLGLSYGQPVVTKRADGTWVVVFTSGLNNVSPGDGNGHLFVLNAGTGALLHTVPTYITGTTAAGNTSTPSGLMKLNAWVPEAANNTALRFYGADMLGNIWRFEIDGPATVATDGTSTPFVPKATLLAQLEDANGNAQPVTARLELAEVTYGTATYPVVLAGTGRYLGKSDLNDATENLVQSIYAVKDPLTSTGWGVLRDLSTVVAQTLTVSGNTATVTSNAVDWSTKAGWYVDLPNANERIAIDMSLQYNTLAAVSAIPTSDTCSASGESWLYYFNVNNGSTVLSSGSTAGNKLGKNLGMGLTWVQLSDGTSRLLIPSSNAELRIEKPGVSTGSAGDTPRRTSWRELLP